MDTLVVCVDRAGDIARRTGLDTPVVGWEAVRSLVVDAGLADPEDSGVNCLLEALRIARDLRTDEEAGVALVSGVSETVVGTDRAVAAQLDELLARFDPESAVVVVDSAEDEQVVPIIESRVRVDSVDRVVVRQARDIESTYYLLKQFLADEELRQTVLVPIGIVLLVFPALLMVTGSLPVAVASITAVLGIFVLYKGLGVDEHLAAVPGEARNALYSGRVSIVTYVVGAGLALVGVVSGAFSVSDLPPDAAVLTVAMAFVFDSVPWLALAALAASTGRLVDEAIRTDRLPASYLNLPFGVVSVGLVVRGFSAYFLERAGTIGPLHVPSYRIGILVIDGEPLSPELRLATFVGAGVLVSLIGIRTAAYFGGARLDGPDGDELLK